MDAFFDLLGTLFILFAIGVVWNLFWTATGTGINKVTAATKAAARSRKSGKSFSEEFEEESYRMGPLQARAIEDKADLGGKLYKMHKIEIRGLINKTEIPYDLQCVISFFDITGQKKGEEKYNKPILTPINELMEIDTRAVQLVIPIGQVNGLNGYQKWTHIHQVYPDFLIGQKKGVRNIRGIIRFLPNQEKVLSEINYGLGPADDTLLAAFGSFDFKANLQETGYEEARDNYFKIRSFCVQFGVLMAFSDGELEKSEGEVIKKWISHQIDLEADKEDKEKLKTILNETLKKSYANAKEGKLALDKLTTEFKKITSRANSISMLEFLFEIIGADGQIDEAEMKVVQSIGSKLDISRDELKAMTDKTFLNSSTGDLEQGQSAANILGITDDMSKEEIKTLLNKEFKKWNGRIQALEDGEEKDKAQQMLNVIAEARKKYA